MTGGALAPEPRAGVLQRAVVVHGGARDSYQLALALSEAGLLEELVTDLFWPVERSWAQTLAERLSPGLRELLERRSAKGLPFGEVRLCLVDGLRCLLMDKLPGVPFALRRRSNRDADAALGRTAGRRARETNAGLVSYSYFGYHSISTYGRPSMLFQVHPHPLTIRRILSEELAMHPECKASLSQEWELALPEDEFEQLVVETQLASRFLAASSFTRSSLIEHGANPDDISVVPYGVDLQRFHPAAHTRQDDRLHLLFVGRINQRKGVKYLIEAMRLLPPDRVRLTICGRVVDDLRLFQEFAGQIEIRPSVSEAELVKAYQQADLFVFPSVAEGFGQVLLEALASGLPILSTTHTAAPDLIVDGREGFIVPPRRPDLLAEKIEWAMKHPEQLRRMSVAARSRAEEFTWKRFREGVASAVREYLSVAATRVTRVDAEVCR